MQHENHLDIHNARWFAVYTRYKREKIVCNLLSKKGVHTYLPLRKVTRRYTRKIKHLEIPLISCYIFVKIIKSQYVPVLETEHVVQFIRFSKNLLAIPDAEIDLLKRVVGEKGLEIEAEPSTYQEGDEVEIITGNLTGLKGKLIAVQGKKQMLIELENMGYSLRLSIDPSLIKRVISH